MTTFLRTSSVVQDTAVEQALAAARADADRAVRSAAAHLAARRLAPGRAYRARHPPAHAYRQATTVAWLGIVACQIGTAFAVRTDHASLRSVGLLSNRFLQGGIAFSLAFAAMLVYVPALHPVFGTAALCPAQLATVAPYPFIVWGADEIRRMLVRRRGRPVSRRHDGRAGGAVHEGGGVTQPAET